MRKTENLKQIANNTSTLSYGYGILIEQLELQINDTPRIFLIN